LTILGAWKVVGAIALLIPRSPRLKEWAYAGIFFNMTGAAASRAFVGDYGPHAFHLVVTLGFAGLALASRALLPHRGRGIRSPTRTWRPASARATPVVPAR
jgi:hypothetical protein